MHKKVITGIIIGIVVISVVAAGIMAGRPAPLSSSARGNIGVINITGMITTGGSTSPVFGEVTAGSDEINKQIREAADNPNLKAVVLRLNSPGGTVAGTQEIAVEVDRLRKSGKKVVASMGDVAASGAYWIAARADKIVANPGTITGSIGVIMQTTNLEGLYEKLGIEENTFKKGKYKDMGSPTRKITGEEKAIIEGMIDEHYRQFIRAVAEGRNMDLDQVRKLATGRVFTGSQARDVGLVDELGNFYDAVNLAAELAGIRGKPVVVNLGPEKNWWDILESVAFRPFESVNWQRFLEEYPAAWLLYSPEWKAGYIYNGR